MAEDMANIEAVMREQEIQNRIRESKALIAWTNTFLKKRDLEATSITNSFSDGVLLINLLEVAFGDKFGKYKVRPKQPFHKLENITKAFDVMEKTHNIVLLGIDANDIAKKQEKQTINVLWNTLRAHTLKGLGAVEGGASGSMRDNLLAWCRAAVVDRGIEINDFWDTFKDGIVFCSIMEYLSPGTIDLDSLDPNEKEKNLTLAFTTAETQLGIPPLLSVEDLADGKKSNETAVMNYVCMLVSAASGNQKRQEQMKRVQEAAEAEKKKRQQEHEEQRKRLEEELAAQKATEEAMQKKMEEEIQAQMEKFQNLHTEQMKLQESIETANKDAADEKSKRAEESQLFLDQMKMMKDTFLQQQKTMQEQFESERAKFLEQITGLNDTQEQLNGEYAASKADLEGQRDKLDGELTQSQSELYHAYKEQENIVENFKQQLTQGIMSRRAMDAEEKQEAFNQLILENINAEKTADDFIASLPKISAWLMKKRPDAKLMGRASAKRYFTLRGDTLFWGKDMDRALEKSVDLKQYVLIDRTDLNADGSIEGNTIEVTGRVEEGSKRLSIFGKKKSGPKSPDGVKNQKKGSIFSRMKKTDSMDENGDPTPIKRRASVINVSKKHGTIIRLQPEQAASTFGGSAAIELMAEDATDIRARQDLVRWVDLINNRIALLRYLKTSFNQLELSRGGRDVISFIVDPQKSVLKIENKITDLHRILVAFKEPLSFRKDLELVFTNCMFTDHCVEVLAEIIEANKSCKVVSLQQNIITEVGAKRLAEALRINQSLEVLLLDQNQLGDQGLVYLAESLPFHRKLRRLGLNGNEIGDNGVSALCMKMLDSQTNLGEPHYFPLIELSANKIGDVGCKQLARLVGKNPTITTLSLSSNLITDKGLGVIVEAAEKSGFNLTEVHVADNQLSSKSMGSVVQLLKESSKLSLDLSHNKLISGSGISQILAAGVSVEFQNFHIIKKAEGAEPSVSVMSSPEEEPEPVRRRPPPPVLADESEEDKEAAEPAAEPVAEPSSQPAAVPVETGSNKKSKSKKKKKKK